MLGHEADDGLRVVVHRRDYIYQAEYAQQHKLVATKIAASLQDAINIEILRHGEPLRTPQLFLAPLSQNFHHRIHNLKLIEFLSRLSIIKRVRKSFRAQIEILPIDFASLSIKQKKSLQFSDIYVKI